MTVVRVTPAGVVAVAAVAAVTEAAVWGKGETVGETGTVEETVAAPARAGRVGG